MYDARRDDGHLVLVTPGAVVLPGVVAVAIAAQIGRMHLNAAPFAPIALPLDLCPSSGLGSKKKTKFSLIVKEINAFL